MRLTTGILLPEGVTALGTPDPLEGGRVRPGTVDPPFLLGVLGLVGVALSVVVIVL